MLESHHLRVAGINCLVMRQMKGMEVVAIVSMLGVVMRWRGKTTPSLVGFHSRLPGCYLFRHEQIN